MACYFTPHVNRHSNPAQPTRNWSPKIQGREKVIKLSSEGIFIESNWAMKKSRLFRVWGYMEDYAIQLYGDYFINHNQDSTELEFFCRFSIALVFQTPNVRRYDWTPQKPIQKTKPEQVFGRLGNCGTVMLSLFGAVLIVMGRWELKMDDHLPYQMVQRWGLSIKWIKWCFVPFQFFSFEPNKFHFSSQIVLVVRL